MATIGGGPLQNEHPEITNIINNVQNNLKINKIIDLKMFLENSKQFGDFRKYLIEKNKYSLASMLQCYEAIQSFKQSFLVDNPPFNLKLANDIISTFLIKPNSTSVLNISPNSSSSLLFSNAASTASPVITGNTTNISPPPSTSTSFYIGFIDNSVYNSLKVLLDPLWQKPSSSTSSSSSSVPFSNPLSTSSSSINNGGSLFDSSPLDNDSDLFGTTSTTENNNNNNDNNNDNNNNNNEDKQVEDPEEPTKEQIKKQKEIKDDLSSHVTHNLFDILIEFLLFKLEVEFRKYMSHLNSSDNLGPLSNNNNSNNNNNNNNNTNSNNIILDSPLTPKKIDKEDSSTTGFYINNSGGNSGNMINYNRLEGENRIVWFGDQDHVPIYYMDPQCGAIVQSLLYITEFRFLFISKQTMNEITSIPLTTVYRIDRVNNFKFDSICIWGKNFRRIEFHIDPRDYRNSIGNQFTFGGSSPYTNNTLSNSSGGGSGSSGNDSMSNNSSNNNGNGDITIPIINRMRIFAFPSDVSNFFAFKYSPNKQAKSFHDGWNTYNGFGEWLRQGILSGAPDSNNKWRWAEKNIEYQNPTYPKFLVVPHNISDEDVGVCMNFRSKGRIPVLSWISKDGIPLARSSQPMVGITRQKCSADEKLVDAIRMACPTGKSLFLLDARPKANAIANVAKGMGYELNYNCDIEFLGIANIHSMRDSINKLEQFCQANNDENWLSGLNETKWLDHVRTVLLGVARAVNLINKGHPVLLHCSDGWDRTSQISSLTMIIQDPYYRTVEGFQVLIEKEWLSFGHCFMNRVRHGDRNSYSDNQRSPVFLQFIDCVYQLMNQYHDYFQFNENYLITILDALYSCQYGTFLCNSEKERSVIKRDTVSLWSFINSNPLTPYLNPFYNGSIERAFHIPEWRSEHITLWKGYYLRYWRNPLREPQDYQKIATNLKLKNIHLLLQVQNLIAKNQELSKENQQLKDEKEQQQSKKQEQQQQQEQEVNKEEKEIKEEQNEQEEEEEQSPKVEDNNNEINNE